MSPQKILSPSAALREKLRARGGAPAAKCYQCGTCTAVCELTGDYTFPRRQMLYAQWGLAEELASDAGVWLCHQCNDCSERCPRDAKPGDVMQSARALAIETLAVPASVGKLVGNAGVTWPLLIGLPTLLIVAMISVFGGLGVPEFDAAAHPHGPDYNIFVPKNSVIYGAFIPAAILAFLAIFASGKRFWSTLGKGANRTGTLLSNLVPAVKDVLTHKRFGDCDTAAPRKSGHMFLFWGFVAAFITTTAVAFALYVLREPLPLKLTHPFKLIGNLSAVLLTVGCVMLVANRLKDSSASGKSTAFDNFFLGLVILVTATGIGAEVFRLMHSDPSNLSGWFMIGCWTYVLHLGAVLALFLTMPYSKFAHMIYRTLAIVHERMTSRA